MLWFLSHLQDNKHASNQKTELQIMASITLIFKIHNLKLGVY